MGRSQPSTKYRNRKVKYDGYKFDSEAECERYKQLRLLEKAGEIKDLKVQPKYPLKSGDVEIKIRSERYPGGRRASYYGDFSYRDKAGNEVIEDVKGKDTQVSRLKRAIVEAAYGVQVTIVR